MLAEILGKAGVKYLPLLYQLLVFEGTFYEKWDWWFDITLDNSYSFFNITVKFSI